MGGGGIYATPQQLTAFGLTWRCDTQMSDFENRLETPEANASNLNATLESTVQMFLQSDLQKLTLNLIVGRLPLSTLESLVVFASSWACCLNFGDEFHHDPEADIDEIALDGAVVGVGLAIDHPWSVVI